MDLRGAVRAGGFADFSGCGDDFEGLADFSGFQPGFADFSGSGGVGFGFGVDFRGLLLASGFVLANGFALVSGLLMRGIVRFPGVRDETKRCTPQARPLCKRCPIFPSEALECPCPETFAPG